MHDIIGNYNVFLVDIQLLAISLLFAGDDRNRKIHSVGIFAYERINQVGIAFLDLAIGDDPVQLDFLRIDDDAVLVGIECNDHFGLLKRRPLAPFALFIAFEHAESGGLELINLRRN